MRADVIVVTCAAPDELEHAELVLTPLLDEAVKE